MIDERGLVAAIKDTWRHEGYAVAGYGSGDERALCLNGASWLAVMPRRTTSLTVLLCGESCHRNGPRAAHRCKETALALHQYGQRKYMEEQDATVEDFRREFGRNYL